MAWKKRTGQNKIMAQDETKKEALFNEVKGSLFEFLVGKELASRKGEELSYLKSLDKNYLNVLSQQDRMVRQFYPEMLDFLLLNAKSMAEELITYFEELPVNPVLLGKMGHEADLLIHTRKGEIPLSLKLNKKNAYVNTKSGGVKSFFSQYFSTISDHAQKEFNQLVGLEFSRMAIELHELHGLEFAGNFNRWVEKGLSELPGELDPAGRLILKSYYARLAASLHNILSDEFREHQLSFIQALPALMGFSSEKIYQAVCFHDFKSGTAPEIFIHSYQDLKKEMSEVKILPFENISSVEIQLGKWSLQIRIKPMNKFTTTAIKVNCSVKIKRPNGA